MRDVQLWWRLQDELDAELLPELEQLAELPLRKRGPFFGLMSPLLSHADARLRRAAIRVLSGTRGMAGVRAVTGALDDPELSVRLAAVEALRATAKDEPARWAHAIFHPRVDVRLAALAGEAPEHAAYMGAYLRSDAQCRETAKAAPWPEASLSLALGLHERRALDGAGTLDVFAKASTAKHRTWLTQTRRRSVEDLKATVSRLSGSTKIAANGVDRLDTWVALVLEHPDASEVAIRRMTEAIMASKLAAQRTRVMVAVVVAAARVDPERVPQRLLWLACACDPRMLGFEGLPLALRARAATGLLHHKVRSGALSWSYVKRLLDSDLVEQAGLPQLSVCAGVSCLLRSGRLDKLVDRFGVGALVTAALDDLDGWLALCRLPDESTQWNTRMLQLASERHAKKAVGLQAIAVAHWARVEHEALDRAIDGIGADAMALVIPRIVELAQSGRLAQIVDVLGKLGRTLGSRVTVGQLGPTVSRLIGLLAVEPAAPAEAMLQGVIACCDPEDIARAAAEDMVPERSAALVEALRRSLGVKSETELALAEALREHVQEDVRQWAEARLALEAAPTESTRPEGVRELTKEERKRIAEATGDDLVIALAPALAQPVTGLIDALAARSEAPEPHSLVCVALAACHDPLENVARAIERWSDDSEDFDAELDIAMVGTWQGRTDVSMLAHAWLARWEKHAFALTNLVRAAEGVLLGFLRRVQHLEGLLARRKLWWATAHFLNLMRYRARARMPTTVGSDVLGVIDTIVGALDTEVGRDAARVLVSIHLAGIDVKVAEKQLLAVAPDVSKDTIAELSRLIRIDGLPVREVAARRHVGWVGESVLVEIAGSDDMDALAEHCRGTHPGRVRAAAERLIALGVLGERRLAGLLGESPPVPRFARLAETVPSWTDAKAKDLVISYARDRDRPPQLRYRLAIAIGHVDSHWNAVILEALVASSEDAWFTRADWTTVSAYFSDELALSRGLASSPHPHAYRNAVELVLASDQKDPATLEALRAFLEQGSLRPSDLRRHAAMHLHAAGDPVGLPVLMEACSETGKDWAEHLVRPDKPELARALAELFLAATLYGGPSVCDELRQLEIQKRLELDWETEGVLRRRLLLDARNPATCRRIVQQDANRGAERIYKLLDVADVFAWGVRRGRELTGRLFSVHMTYRRGDYGHTYLNTSGIHVTPLPILKREREGRTVVEALILHEFGHHMYHRGHEPERIWAKAQSEGLGHILNLVADEHLERNLRALRSEYGDRLKKLAAYAFLHNDREMIAADLLAMLGAYAFEALSVAPLGVAFDGRMVVVKSGDLLREMERQGHGFARFVRALRMGLGNRHGDPMVDEAMKLFASRFRHSSMAQMYAIARRLAEMFGSDAAMAKQFGGHETIKGNNRDAAVHGGDLEDEEVQREVERILDPRQKERMRGGPDDGRPPKKLAINVIPNSNFDVITNIEKVLPDLAVHRRVAKEVGRHADRVREAFERMGLNLVPQRARMRGRAFDRTRARAVVLRRDPRMLVAREVVITTDLHIGVVIDCSGSMRTGNSMTKAHRFGVLLAEAVRPLHNVDARFFGFTDRLIYDAGDQRQCAVTSLQSGGGNNDAAALYHASRIAERSPRRAKLLVMISDGLPTECTAASVRALAEHLTRRKGLMCAQVAVRPLEEVCFPHYVEIRGNDIDAATLRFGEIVSKLARQAIGR